MNIKYGCPYWGNNQLTPEQFIQKALQAGYDGLELFLQPPDTLTDDFLKVIDEAKVHTPDFFFIALQLTFPGTDRVEDYIKRMEKNLWDLVKLNPQFINSHTGRDFYSFDDNCRIIEAIMDVEVKSGIHILHETHRGRFSFHAATLLNYLNKFPGMRLVGDFSHFCTVSESMLEDQQEILEKIIPHVFHIHARIGHEQGPQVNDPSAPEWQSHLEVFMDWWKRIVEYKKQENQDMFTISPEFGPAPYMPVMPLTQKPLSDQWSNNVFMLNKLKEYFGC